jgi:hypothetical protein
MRRAGYSVLELWDGRLPSEDLAEAVYIAMAQKAPEANPDRAARAA